MWGVPLPFARPHLMKSPTKYILWFHIENTSQKINILSRIFLLDKSFIKFTSVINHSIFKFKYFVMWNHHKIIISLLVRFFAPLISQIQFIVFILFIYDVKPLKDWKSLTLFYALSSSEIITHFNILFSHLRPSDDYFVGSSSRLL